MKKLPPASAKLQKIDKGVLEQTLETPTYHMFTV